jgi:hypothetical protein
MMIPALEAGAGLAGSADAGGMGIMTFDEAGLPTGVLGIGAA